MISLLFATVVVAQAGEPNALGFMLPVLLVIVMYFLLIARPQKREMMAKAAMLKSLKKNDHVVTYSGIHGVVTQVRPEANEVVLRVDDNSNTKLRMTLSSVAKITGPSEETPEAS